MSLINKMLQDLERRSAGNLINGGLQQQLRAVPERDGIHVAWWLVLLLALLLAAACVWFWLRPAPPVAPVAPTPAVALRPAPVVQAPVVLAPVPPVLVKPVPAPPPLVPLMPPATGSTVVATVATVAQDARHHQAVPGQPNTISTEATEAKPVLAARPKTTVPTAKNSGQAGTSISGGDDSAAPGKLAKQVKELTPQQRAENDYRRAGSVLQQGRQSEAIAALEQALQFDAQHAAARQMLVGLLLQAKRTDEALQCAQEGLALDPAQVGLAMILARVQVERGDVRPALDTLLRSLPYAQERADYQAFLAALLQRDKRHKEAIEHYVAALAKTPQNGLWWMGLGISLQAENRLPEAKEAFGRAIASNTLTPALQAFVDQKLVQLAH
jgi:MSHA biogenesis protein MshN